MSLHWLSSYSIRQSIRIAVSRLSVASSCASVALLREVVHFDDDPMETDANVNIELIQRGLRVVVPQASEKDAANVLQKSAGIYEWYQIDE